MKLQIQIFIFYTVIFYLSICFTEATFNIANMDYGVRNGFAVWWLLLVVAHIICHNIIKLNKKYENKDIDYNM